MTLSCPICLEKIKESEAAALSCGHVFDRKCIRECLLSRRVCPICNAAYNDRCGIISLFLNTDDETDTLILDLQRELNKRAGVIRVLEEYMRDEIKKHKDTIVEQNNGSVQLKNQLDRKEKEFNALRNSFNIVRMEANSKQTALNTAKETSAQFKSERDEKTKALSAIEDKLRELSQNSCDLDKYMESKTKYQTLLSKFEKAVDDKVSAKMAMESLQEKITALERSNTQNTASNELVDQIEQLKQENESLKSKTEYKTKYNKLLDSFERLVNEKTATAHEHQKNIENYEKLLQKHEDDSQVKKKFEECQLELSAIKLNLSTTLSKNKELTEQNKKWKETETKLRKEMKTLKREKENMKTGNTKLIAQKNKAYSDLEKLRKKSGIKTEDVTANVANLSVSSAENTTDFQKKLAETRAVETRLLKKTEGLTIRNNELQAQVIKLKLNMEDLKSNKIGSEALSKDKLKELKHHCTQLAVIANLIME
ncbi:hypothetical protein HPULCUR_011534 [Helicostylum pulchrum]|uniref:RING-type domain-containing protein n=1 Tax=Helicostylum pulchrum TaxID=562976 RepID=A0ABP9YGC4_9FUNG